MTSQALMPFRVFLRRLKGSTQGFVIVQASSHEHAKSVAIDQTIAVSYPTTKPENWVVTDVKAYAA